MDFEMSLEIETKTRYTITDDYSYMQFGFTAIISNYSPMKNMNKFCIYCVES